MSKAPPTGPSAMNPRERFPFENVARKAREEREDREYEEARARRQAKRENNAVRRDIRKTQRNLRDEVAEAQQEPDMELDEAIAAFGLSSNAAGSSNSLNTAATSMNTVSTAASAVKAGHYNIHGQFVLPGPGKGPRRKKAKDTITAPVASTNRITKAHTTKKGKEMGTRKETAGSTTAETGDDRDIGRNHHIQQKKLREDRRKQRFLMELHLETSPTRGATQMKVGGPSRSVSDPVPATGNPSMEMAPIEDVEMCD